MSAEQKLKVRLKFGHHMSRRVIGEIQLLLLDFAFLPLTATSFVLPPRCSSGVIPPDIGKLVKLKRVEVRYTKIEGETKIRVTVITCPGA